MPHNKYGARRVVVDGIAFASKAEAKRYGELKLLERSGTIRSLKLQPRYDCVIAGRKVCTYVGDFVYLGQNGMVVEDVKGVRTPVYKLKKKLVEACFPGLRIQEVDA